MSHLLIVELPGGNDTDILVAARAEGHCFSLLSADPGHYFGQPEIASLLVDAASVIDAGNFDLGELIPRLEASHARERFDAILCLQDLRIVEAAQIAHALGLRHLDPGTAELTRDKSSIRRRLAEAGIPQPPFVRTRGASELIAAIEAIGLPALVKPVDGFGSQNIFALRDETDLAALRQIPDLIAESPGDYGLSVNAKGEMLVERLFEGQLVGCDTMTSEGRHVLLGVNEKLLFPAPSFAIRGGCFTANCGQFGVIEDYVFSLLDAIGFDHGAAHVELMLTDEGPQLIEINPRLVGARIPRLLNAALQRSIHANLIDLHLSGALPPLAIKPMHAVTRWLAAPEPGVLQAISLPTVTEPGFVGATILARPGFVVCPPFDNADRLGCVITSGSDRLTAENLAEQLVGSASITLDTAACGRHPAEPDTVPCHVDISQANISQVRLSAVTPG